MQLLIISCLLVFTFGQQQHLSTGELQQLVDEGFQNLDVNPKDGLLEQDELTKLFRIRDTDRDRHLSRAEFGIHMGPNFPFKEPLFNQFDINNDGFLTKDEFVDVPFFATDQNEDSQVSRQEFDPFYTQLLTRFNQLLVIRRKRVARTDTKTQQQHLSADELQQLVDEVFQNLDVNPKYGLLEQDELAKLFRIRDTDGDGHLSRAEFGIHMGPNFPFKEPLFNQFDINNDGVLTKDEFVDKPFTAVDQNGNNQVSRQEFDPFFTQLLTRFNQP